MVDGGGASFGPFFDNFGDFFAFAGCFRFAALGEVFVNCGTAGASESAGQGTDGKTDETSGSSKGGVVGVTFQ